MAKRSPIKNLASSVAGVHRSTLSQLLDSASNAVHQGAQLSQHIVVAASSANKRKQPRDNKTEASAAPAARKGDDKKAITAASTPPQLKSDSGGGVRVRDAIHMFDTAASSSKTKNTKDKKSASPSVTNYTSSSSYHAAASFRHSPYRKYRGVAMKRDDEVGQNDEQHCHHHHHHHNSGSSNQYCDKENSSNNLKKSDKDRHQSLTMTNKLKTATLASANTTTTEHALSPKKSSYLRRHHHHHTTTTTDSIHDCESQTTRTMLDSVVKKCSTSSGVQRGSTTRQTDDNYDSDGLEAEVGVDARKGQGAGSTEDAIHSFKLSDKNDGIKEEMCINFNAEQTQTTTKKRASPDTTWDESTIRVRPAVATPAKKCHHPLIQSPLRKHIKRVHDSACANASCTMIKEPFPLLVLPPVLHQPREERASDRNNFLDTLDALTTTTTSVPTKICATRNSNNMMMKDGEDHDHWQGTSSCSGEEEEGGAIDLLTSASFLFQQSRRKLS